ncbi:MAG TPA: YjjG family noncanonical pyrimidine nucleotidase [Acidimicrobiia bacterium]|nr:YjjG family noncanonical pyrimidine nucleotidase [Acidimicrobiia bacterium]
MPYTTVLLDLDHTLFDFDAAEEMAFDLTMRAAGIAEPKTVAEPYRRINAELWLGVERGEVRPIDVRTLRFERMFSQLGIDADVAESADLFVRSLGRFGDLYPGARDLLDVLSGRVRLALVTNGLSEVQRARIERLGLGGYFDAIVISSEVDASKPRPEIFDIAFDRLGRPPKDSAVMIGDSLASDIAGGANYGIDTCWYNPHRRTAEAAVTITHEVSSLDQIPALVSN